jgi:hypothetical protein
MPPPAREWEGEGERPRVKSAAGESTPPPNGLCARKERKKTKTQPGNCHHVSF